MSTFALPPEVARLPDPYREEIAVVNGLAQSMADRLDWSSVLTLAGPWVQQVRANPAPFWAMESLLREYPISSNEGLALMRLAEALLRVPDAPTAIALTADQLGRGQFDGASEGPHKMFAALSASAISLSKKFLPDAEGSGGLMTRLGAQTVVSATVRAIQLLGRQFVLGRNIKEAMSEAASARKAQPNSSFSYDMLGEGARTEADARRYHAAYVGAIKAIASGARADNPEQADGISIKLSALFSRYEVLQRERVFAELLPRVWELITLAAQANINLTIDAEEVDRLELSLDVLDTLAARIASTYPKWQGFGLAVQAYQTRALQVVDEVAAIARKHGLRLMVRLVKGAYWDGEIKRAQEQGLTAYPVFTHKQHTDVSYLACARALIGHADVIYPQFASHNAGTIAAIVLMARKAEAKFEMQRLHGMGEGVYREFSRHTPAVAMLTTPPTPPAQAGGLTTAGVPVRIYAPVGEHRDLLAYLVRRLLENGANSSFVHQLADVNVQVPELLGSPLEHVQAASALPLPVALYFDRRGHGRVNSSGADLTDMAQRLPLQRALETFPVLPVAEATPAYLASTMAGLQAGFAGWNAVPVQERAAMMRRAADALDARLPEFCALLVKEALKTQGDCVAEVREAVDFLRYYADQAEFDIFADQAESDAPAMQGRGVFVCISPWNFPLAIFAGQVVAALVAGNTVAAKPAEQTPFVALQFVELLYAAGVPHDALQLLHGAGETVGAGLVAAEQTAGVCFTGSTQVAQIINRTLAAKEGAAVPLIAETGGLNAMLVDSTALPEQVIDAVVQSAFRSAGQRCSALRLLCVHESIADGVIEMLSGALQELWVGQPADLATDVGPVIDDEAFENVTKNVERLKREAKLIAEAPVHDGMPRLVRPVAFELSSISALRQEIFGPVLHVVRWGGEPDAVIDQINALGYGLTLGLQTRIDSRALRLAQKARIGNVYVNRNIIGAVVGVQPFGGEGMSGTGPKAGGPNYLYRFCALAALPGLPGLAEAAPAGESPVAVPAVPAVSIASAMAALAVGYEAWSDKPLSERAALLSRAFAGQPEAAVVSRRLALAEKLLADQLLPGPTGESNQLRQHGRGVLALQASAATPGALALGVAAALVAGNSVALLVDGASAAQAELLQARLRAAGLPAEALLLLSGGAPGLTALLDDARLAGICLLSADASAERALLRQMAAEDGAIRPLISAQELFDARQQYRFSAEQTLTINTAAAGGNAALLAGVH